MAVVNIYPTSDFSRDQAFNSDDGTTNLYSYVDEEVASDSDYTYIDVEEDEYGYSLFNMGDIDLPEGASISKITLYIRRFFNILSLWNFRIRINSTNYDYNSEEEVGEGWDTISYELVQNPDTESSWTQNDINSLIYGVYAGTPSSKGMIFLTSQFYIGVDYTEDGTPTVGTKYPLPAFKKSIVNPGPSNPV